jgi:hypothetical protein
MEWVLTCSAFERLLEAEPKAKDVARLFAEIFNPSETISPSDSKRLSNRGANSGNSLSYEWMYEFYRVRGDFAHGKLRSGQPLMWTPSEHMVLGSISFPLCVKALLQRKGYYLLTDDDREQIDTFEPLADQAGFLTEPPDSSGSLDSWWRRCLVKTKRARRLQKALESLGALNGQSRTN